MAFKARYKTRCVVCEKDIMPGDMFTWSRRTKPNGKKGHLHAACAGQDTEEPKTPAELDLENTPESDSDSDSDSDNGRKPLEIILEESVKSTPTTKQSIGHKELELMELLAEAVATRLPANGVDAEQLDAAVQQAINNRLPAIVKVQAPDKPDIELDSVHQSFSRLLYLIGKRHHSYLYGPPGGGKSTAARQASEALGLQFGYISLNPQTPDSRLLGYLDANGNYRKTVFRDCYENGGVFCIDELDNASPSLLTTLNSCLENGVGAFPDSMVAKHVDFVLVATGNTVGRGANPAFPERRPFDGAFAERFSYLAWDYDEKLERNVALQINPEASKWIDFVQALRRWSAQNMPRLIVSPRASFKLAEYSKDGQLSPLDMLDMAVFKGLDSDSKSKCLAAVDIPR